MVRDDILGKALVNPWIVTADPRSVRKLCSCCLIHQGSVLFWSPVGGAGADDSVPSDVLEELPMPFITTPVQVWFRDAVTGLSVIITQHSWCCQDHKPEGTCQSYSGCIRLSEDARSMTFSGDFRDCRSIIKGLTQDQTNEEQHRWILSGSQSQHTGVFWCHQGTSFDAWTCSPIRELTWALR